MSYLVKQRTRSGAVYVYEAEGYWDKAKRQMRQRRRYVGRLDPTTGKVETPRKSLSIRAALDFGVWHLFASIDDGIGLLPALARQFGEDATDIFRLAVHQASEGRPMSLFKDWSEATAGPQGSHHTSQELSRLLVNIGRRDRARESFMADWTRGICRKGRAILFDVTSISTCGEGGGMFEWGYNRDHERLPQVNLGVGMDAEGGLPLFYRCYPGSVADVSMIANLAKDAEAMGVEALRLVLDRGFYSHRNLLALREAKLHFLIPMPGNVRHVAPLLAGTRQALASPLAAFREGGTVVFAATRSLNAGGLRLEAKVYLDEERRADAIGNFIRRATEVEAAAEEAGSATVEEFREKLAQRFPGMEGCFTISRSRGRLVVERDARAMAERMERMGRMILVSDEKWRSPQEALRLYRGKDAVEKFFRCLKNDADGNRIRAHSEEAMQGRLFVMFCAVILHSALRRRMEQADLATSMAVPAVIASLRKLRQVEMANGKTRLTELTREQRALFDKLGVPIPV